MSCCENQCVKYDHFIRTPLIESTQFKEFCNQRVYLKLENCQPCGSFKMRGISRLSQQAVRDGCEEVICASGGNAGLAAACAARRCGIKCRIIVPKTTSNIMKDMIAGEGAHIEVFGDVLNDAEEKAIKEVKKSKKSYFIHPFDNPIIWTGHSTIIDEIVKQLDTIPSLIISSCGGGGLICGLAEGMRRNKWTSVPILAMETKGCNALNASVKAGSPIKPVKIPSINSVATSLGALEICKQLADDYNKGLPPIISHVIDDKETVDACIKFANQHRILVEPACGVSLAAIYTGFVRQLFAKNKGKYSDGPVVVIVCGGCGVTLDILKDYKNKFNL